MQPRRATPSHRAQKVSCTSPQGHLALSRDHAHFGTVIAQVLDGQDSSDCYGRCSLQDVRKDVSFLVVAKQATALLEASGTPCLLRGWQGP